MTGRSTSELARQQRLQLAEATFDPVPSDAACARAYGLVYAETLRAGRTAGGKRAIDLLIAATALSEQIPLYSANPAGFAGLEQLVKLRSVPENAP